MDMAESPENNSKIYKVKWTETEDARLLEIVNKFGSTRWDFIATFIPGRTGRQCRERWMIQFAPDIKKDAWSHEEDQILIQLQQTVGNHWSAISKYLRGRTPIMIKNRFKLLCRHQRIKDICQQNYVECNQYPQIALQTVEMPVRLDDFQLNLYHNQSIQGSIGGTDMNATNSGKNDFDEIDFSNEIFYEESVAF